MSKILLIFIFTIFMIKVVRDNLFFVWLWQIKEYRLDRMASYLKDNRKITGSDHIYLSGLALFLIYLAVLKNFSIFFSISAITFYLVSPGLVILYLIISVYFILKELEKRSLRKPRVTVKTAIIFFLYIIVLSLIALCWLLHSSPIMTDDQYLLRISLLMLLVLTVNPMIISSIIIAIEPVFIFQKKNIIKRAGRKMDLLKKVKTIAITGSYGKTSTKEFLYAILSQKYKVVKTDGNNNTNIGVAYTVLNKVSDDFDYFICEMGAYKIGEIKEMCEIVGPQIGILTGINEQHIELFGNIKNTIKAKFELIEALPENGLAVINEKLKAECGKLKFKVKNLKYFSLDSVNNIKVYQDFVEFDYICHCEEHRRRSNPGTMHKESDNRIATLSSVVRNGSSIIKFKLNILGKHYIENLLSAIMVAEHLGMDLDEINDAISRIKPVGYLMRKLEGANGSVFIDDSYSANPDGVMAALDYLKEGYPEYKKIIVFPGIIELGSAAEEAHRKLHNRISEVCDIAYILDIGNWKLEIGNSLSAQRLHSPKGTMELTKECKFVFEKDFDKAAKMLENDLDKNTAVLFESRGAGVVMGKLTKK